MKKLKSKWWVDILAGKDTEKLKQEVHKAIEAFKYKSIIWNGSFTESLINYLGGAYVSNRHDDLQPKHVNAIKKAAHRNLLNISKRWNRQVAVAEKAVEQVLKDYMLDCLTVAVLTPDRLKVVEDLYEEIEDLFSTRVEKDYSTYSVEQIEVFLDKLDFLGKHITEFEPWDTGYNINLFADSLILTGKYFRKHGHLVNSEKYGRHCMGAGGMLKKAYGGKEDTASNYYHSKITYKFKRATECTKSMHREYHGVSDPERLDKLISFAHIRSTKEESQRQKDAWEYITKQIGKEGYKFPRINAWWD